MRFVVNSIYIYNYYYTPHINRWTWNAKFLYTQTREIINYYTYFILSKTEYIYIYIVKLRIIENTLCLVFYEWYCYASRCVRRKMVTCVSVRSWPDTTNSYIYICIKEREREDRHFCRITKGFIDLRRRKVKVYRLKTITHILANRKSKKKKLYPKVINYVCVCVLVKIMHAETFLEMAKETEWKVFFMLLFSFFL